MNFLKSFFTKSNPSLDGSNILLSVLNLTNPTTHGTDISPSDTAAILISPNDDVFFSEFSRSTKDLLKNSSLYSNIKHRTHTDHHGTIWIIFTCKQFEDLVSAVDYVSSAISDKGFGERMIAAIFKGSFENHNSYWICNYRTSAFYPFIPQGKQSRLNETEIKLGDIFKKHGLKVEPQEKWFAIWEAPF